MGAIIASQAALSLVPEVLDSIEMVAPVGEQLGMIDPHVVKLRDVKYVIAFEAV